MSKTLLTLCGYTKKDVAAGNLAELTERFQALDAENLTQSCGVGMPTLEDAVKELLKPGRDPRQAIKVFEFDKNVKTIDDLKEGMVLPGIVTNITNFGCFVDVGIKENGLVHVSQLCREFVSDPTTVVSIHQHVQVKVVNIDRERKRIGLSMILD